MRLVDTETIEHHGIPGPELMENAGRGIAENIISHVIGNIQEAKIATFCGKGNNGGDGYVVSRYLFKAGAKVTIYYIGPAEKLSPDARLNYDRARELQIPLVEISSIDDVPDTLEADYIIDAIFGTGFAGAPRGLTAKLIEYINQQDAIVIAVDMPSGLNADTGQHEGAVVRASYTYPLALPKYGLFVTPGRELAGEVHVIPIGVPDEVIDKFAFTVDLITTDMVTGKLPIRPPDGHKGTFGKLFVLAGSTGLTGAAALTAKAAYRCGCGLVKIGCPKTVLPIIAGMVIEATSWALPDVAKKGALAVRALGEIRKLIADHDGVVIGPGLGQHHETKELIRRLIAKLEQVAVVDADGLNALVGHTDILQSSPATLILTPHPGEFRRLFDKPVPVDIHQRIELARTTAGEYGVILVLKGSPTVVATPEGHCFVNPTGNNGMATGGTGDVLSGAIGSLLVQGMSPVDAAVCGVYIHGVAGDLAATDLTARSMTAADMVDYLPEVFLMIE